MVKHLVNWHYEFRTPYSKEAYGCSGTMELEEGTPAKVMRAETYLLQTRVTLDALVSAFDMGGMDLDDGSTDGLNYFQPLYVKLRKAHMLMKPYKDTYKGYEDFKETFEEVRKTIDTYLKLSDMPKEEREERLDKMEKAVLKYEL